MDENWGRPTPNLYVYLICAVFLGLLIIIIIVHPDVTSNREDKVSKSTEDLIRIIPLSKDCCFFEKNQKILHRPLQKMQNLCKFYAIFAAFQLFKFFQTNLNNIHDVHVLNFISNYM